MAAPPSLPILLNDMQQSINDFALISQKLSDPQWVALFRSLTPVEFGSVISCVNTAFDQPRVAMLLAPHLHQGAGIQCVDVAAAVLKSSTCKRRQYSNYCRSFGQQGSTPRRGTLLLRCAVQRTCGRWKPCKSRNQTIH